MSIADLLKRQAPDALMLTGFWYRALPSEKVKPGQLHKALLLEIPLVIGRDRNGRAFALRDACPHRGMPLSCGQFDGEQVECSYHGWRFEAHSGQCQLIPSLTADQNLKVDRIYAGNYACEERDSFVWVFIPDPGPPGAGFSRREETPFQLFMVALTITLFNPPIAEKLGSKYLIQELISFLRWAVPLGIAGLIVTRLLLYVLA